jgi:hypothetical protein
MTNPTGYVERSFPDFGAKVVAPSWVTVAFSRVPSDPRYDRTQDNFTFRRLIGNLKFEAPGRTEFTFDPPAQLQVVVPEDFRPLRASLKLAWWNGSEWVPLPAAGADAANLAVSIYAISEPPISWGT